MKIKLLDLALIFVILVFFMALYMHLQDQNVPPGKNDQQYLPEKVAKNESFYDSPKAAATVPQTRKDSTTVVDPKPQDLKSPRAQAQEPEAMIAGAEESQQIDDFIIWSQKRGIKLVGINKTAKDLYYKGLAEEDFLPIDNIPNLLEVANGLYEIPDSLLEVMEGKTFYLSNQPGRGTVVTASWPDRNILVNVDRGCILEQRFTKRQTIHEFAHILDFHGIQGIYKDQKDYWPYLKEVRDEIFGVPFAYDRKRTTLPPGYMDVYSTANPAENFAQHFMYFILYGDEFRKKAQNDLLLQKKYDFFKKELFYYLEYGL
jgi:hypothetical protein